MGKKSTNFKGEMWFAPPLKGYFSKTVSSSPPSMTNFRSASVYDCDFTTNNNCWPIGCVLQSLGISEVFVIISRIIEL